MTAGAADVPVLLIAFRRPETTRRVLDALAAIAPEHLYVHADGPRAGRADDRDACERTRRLFDDVGWDGEVHRLFQARNLGIRAAEVAIDWFFANVEAGIVLHDDCLPAPDFVPFCAELLDRYRDTPDVMMICGHNQLGTWGAGGHPYVFGRTAACWGWATWRRAWALYDPQVRAWRSRAERASLLERVPAAWAPVMKRRFDAVARGEYEGYDFAWQLALVANDGLAITPAGNLITNIGFDDHAIFTRIPWPHEVGIPATTVSFPLAPGGPRRVDDDYETALFKRCFPLSRRVITRLPAGVQVVVRRLAGHHTLQPG